MTYFVLIVRLRNNVRLKILETKNATKLRKEVSKSGLKQKKFDTTQVF